MKSQYIIVLGLLVGSLMPELLQAQNEVDALRYSFQGTPGSARSLGMGGAFGALGADPSSFWNNPGGLGMYKRNAFELSFKYNDRTTFSSFLGNDEDASDVGTRIQNLAMITTRRSNKDERLQVTFGFGIGNLNTYDERIRIEGTNSTSTLMDVFAFQAQGTPRDIIYDQFPFSAGLAYETYLIDPLDTIAHTYIPAENANRTSQTKVIDRSGRHNEMTFGFGFNFDEKWSGGFSLGIQTAFFRETSSYTEKFPESDYIVGYTFNEDINAGGSGVVARIGGIYRASEWLRVGAGWQSPVRLNIDDAYSTSINSSFVDGSTFNAFSPELSSNFSVRVPGKLMVNSAFILGKSGVIATDYEYTDFSNIQMRSEGLSSDYSYEEENETIRNIYTVSHKVKVGMEWRLIEWLRLRAGASYQTSPFEDGVAQSDPILNYTGGIGFRKGKFYLDLAGSYQAGSESYWLYNPALVDETRIDTELISGIITFGFRY